MRFLFRLFSVLCCCLPSFAAFADVRLELPAANEEALREPLEAASLSLREADEGSTVQDRIAAARADYARLLGALYDRGYFAAEVSILIDGREAGEFSPFSAPQSITNIRIRVDPGLPFRFGQVEIGPLAPATQPIEGFATGSPATVPILRDAARAAITDWRDEGHATAEITRQNLQALNRDAVLNAQIRIDPGPQLRFGRLSASGLERLSPARFQEIAGLPNGSVFSPLELDRAADRLRRTGIFSSVSFSEGEANPDGTIDINANVIEAPLRRFGFGAELSSTEGGTLSGFWLHRNLSGNGDRLRFDAEISGIGQDSGNPDFEITADISRPASATPDTTFTATATLAYQDEDTFETTFFAFSAGAEQRLSDHLTGEVRAGFRFAEVSDAFGTRTVTLLTLPLALIWDDRDDQLDAASGYYADLSYTPFYATDSQEFGSRLVFDARAYRGFGEDNRTRLAARLQLGSIFGGDFLDLPADFLFFSGGGGTVRGQDFNSLGVIRDGEETGGRGFVGISTEWRQDITDTFGGVAFFDAGYISSGALFDDSGEWHSGAGVGIRYQTGIGAIRFDLAVPIEDGPESGQDFHVYIGIGQSF